MKISIIGTGYVGLVSGVCLAEKGHQVICVDIDKDKVNLINQGTPPIFEKNLGQLLRKNIGKNISATTRLDESIMKTELSMIAVGTPFDGEKIDLTYIEKVSKQIGAILKNKHDYHVVVVKSTVVPGTTDNVVTPLIQKMSGKHAGIDFGIGMNPEFLREGVAVDDFMYPDRIVIGGIDEKTCESIEVLYDCFEGVDIIKTNNKTAEMIKYTSNSLLATMISFSNEIGNLCAALDNVDTIDVMKGVHLDKRLAPIMEDGTRIIPGFITYLESGCGFGGSCFPKDVNALIAFGENAGEEMNLLKSVVKINKSQPHRLITLLEKHIPDLSNKNITVLGLSFKPGTDDMRESPSIPIIQTLLEKGAKVKAYDPVARNEAMKIWGNEQISYHDDLVQAVKGADAIVLVTRWPEFTNLPKLVSGMQKPPVVVDGRRMLDKNALPRYEGVGLRVSI